MLKMAVVGMVALVLVGGALGLGGCASYRANVTDVRTVSGIDVQVTQASGSFWQVTATNNTADIARLVWDESTYVATTGESDRLLRGKTRLIHSGQAQPASPIAPGARLQEYCLRESAADHAQYSGAPGDPNSAARIILVFEVNGRKQLHESSILFTKSQ